MLFIQINIIHFFNQIPIDIMQKLIFLNLRNIFINQINDFISQIDILILFNDRELDHSYQLNDEFGSGGINLK